MPEKIQKALANVGIGSRRQIEEWILENRITVNEQPAVIGCKVNGGERICIDGKLIKWQAQSSDRTRVLIYHKPEGEVATRSDPQQRPTVFDHLPVLRRQRWIQVGRLDLNTSGLLIFTTNGALANYLMHPRYEFEREYAVRIMGTVTDQALLNLKNGVMLDDGMAHFDSITRDPGGTGINHWYHVVLKEGRQREVRRLWETQEVLVSRLIRVRYGSITLPRMLRPGQYDEMTPKAITAFLEECGFVDSPTLAHPERKKTHANKAASAVVKKPFKKPSGERTARPPSEHRESTRSKQFQERTSNRTNHRSAKTTDSLTSTAPKTKSPRPSARRSNKT